MQKKTISAEPSNEDTILIRLPPEILTDICTLLPNSDIKTLRLTCSQVCKVVKLRLDRVFLSPNPRNIAVFRAVADHADLRRGVREIIYDDARLKTSWLTKHRKEEEEPKEQKAPVVPPADATPLERYHMRLGPRQKRSGREQPKTVEERRALEERGAKHWFRTKSLVNNDDLRARRGKDDPLLPQHVARAKMFAVQPRWEKCWPLYATLAKQQLRAVKDGADETALAYGLARFPKLERVTVTPATHGFMYTPLYHTPMIRALPFGYNYVMPRGWPCVKRASLADTSPWVLGEDMTQAQVDSIKRCWRGLLMVVKQLAEEVETKDELVLPELVIDVHGLNAGLNPHMFAQITPDYAHFVTILSQPGFRRLDIPLMLGGLVAEKWSCLTNGFFRALLAKARDLEHFRLTSDAEENTSAQVPPGSTKHCPLSRILPASRWKHLRHFGLYRIPIQVDDLLAVLAALPDTLRSVELSFLLFTEKSMCYQKLLEEMKSRLVWKNRQPQYRPKVCIGLPVMGASQAGRAIWVSKEVDEFLYGDGPNPFTSKAPAVKYGVGVMTDDFEPDYQRPHVDRTEMVKLGFHPPTDETKDRQHD